jgi:hypothetical protein
LVLTSSAEGPSPGAGDSPAPSPMPFITSMLIILEHLSKSVTVLYYVEMWPSFTHPLRKWRFPIYTILPRHKNYIELNRTLYAPFVLRQKWWCTEKIIDISKKLTFFTFVHEAACIESCLSYQQEHCESIRWHISYFTSR